MYNDFFNNNLNNVSKEEAKNKFVSLENKMKSIISKCKKKNLIDNFENDLYLRGALIPFGFSTDTSVEVYKVDDLYVYKFLKGNNPIDYLITEKPLLERKGDFINYTGAKGFEYSLGGSNCSLDFGPMVGVGNSFGTNYENNARISVFTTGMSKPNCCLVSYKNDSGVIITDRVNSSFISSAYRLPTQYRYFTNENIGMKFDGCSLVEAIDSSVVYNKEFVEVKSVLDKVEKSYSQKRN